VLLQSALLWMDPLRSRLFGAAGWFRAPLAEAPRRSVPPSGVPYGLRGGDRRSRIGRRWQQQEMAVDDRLSDVHELVAVVLRVVA
jgi:hypothetical protein